MPPKVIEHSPGMVSVEAQPESRELLDSIRDTELFKDWETNGWLEGLQGLPAASEELSDKLDYGEPDWSLSAGLATKH
jgi:hypothetical protein